jgi:hypothetical protein
MLALIDITEPYELNNSRQLYFGSSEITDPQKSTGGFFKYSIPVSKAIVYSDILKDDEKLKFLKQLDESGFEIGMLYRNDSLNQNKTEEALQFFRREFSAFTVVNGDSVLIKNHSLYNPVIVRLLQKYGIKNICSIINIPDSLQYYKSQNKKDEVKLNYILMKNDPGLSNLTDKTDLENDMVIAFTADKYYSSGQDGRDKLFEKGLIFLSSLRNNGILWITTINSMVSYRASIDNVFYEVTEDKMMVKNNSGMTINGLTFSTELKQVTGDKVKIISKMKDNKLVFWFDINPSETVTLYLK